MNFASAFNRVVQTAVQRAWVSERVPIPKLSRKGEKGQTRPAFSAEDSLRHTYATQALFTYATQALFTYATQALLSGTDIHTLAKQMGTSVRMLELHYSKLTATMAADKLA